MGISEVSKAVRLVKGDQNSKVLVTCEHASDCLPFGWKWSEMDSRLSGTHWMVDLGAESLTCELAEALRAPAVLAGFTRLFCDVNRSENSPTIFSKDADGELIELNSVITQEEKKKRLEVCYRPYHCVIDEALRGYPNVQCIVSMHTFSPVYEGKKRMQGIGVLFDRDEELAHRIAEALQLVNVPILLNEPYSGENGFMYAASSHAQRFHKYAVEVEVRQDLVCRREFRDKVVQQLCRCLV